MRKKNACVVFAIALLAPMAARAADNPISCTGANCDIVLEPRDGSNNKVTSGRYSATGFHAPTLTIDGPVFTSGGNGLLSSEAQLDRTRGGTGVSSTATFPTTATDHTSSFAMRAADVITVDASNVTLTNASARRQMITLNDSRDLTLPTTGIAQGEVFEINTIATDSQQNTLTIKASGGQTITKIKNFSDVRLVALVATPTTAANWRVVSLEEQGSCESYARMRDATTASTAVPSWCVYVRDLRTVKLTFYTAYFTIGGASGNVFFGPLPYPAANLAGSPGGALVGFGPVLAEIDIPNTCQDLWIAASDNNANEASTNASFICNQDNAVNLWLTFANSTLPNDARFHGTLTYEASSTL